MVKKKGTKALDTTTEEKIKAAARTVFHKKGFAATRTRDIAEEADINLALLNYYFRSKGKLFEIIMLETLSVFMQNLMSVFNNEETTLEQKIEIVASKYIDLITNESDIPIFIMSEIRNNPSEFLKKMPIKELVINSTFMKQHQIAVEKGKITESNPLHFIFNVMSLIIFPFIAKPLIKSIGNMKDIEFNKLMQERKQLIPIWIKVMMKAK